MSNLNLQELRNYENWVNKSAQMILNSVKGVGGWISVFPNDLPLWAHRVRNYFNQEPTHLTRFKQKQANIHRSKIDSALKDLQLRRFLGRPKIPNGDVGSTLFDDNLGENNALFNYVYYDLFNNIWYQMDAGGTIYHWGKNPTNPRAEAFWQSKVRGQSATPVFKLVSPDGTGGSMETIIKSEKTHLLKIMDHKIKTGRWSIEEPNVIKDISNLIVRDSWHQGSYNYSETVVTGLGNHERRDVATHTKFKFPGVYVNPPNRFASLSTRIFPEKVIGEDNLLAKQVTHNDI